MQNVWRSPECSFESQRGCVCHTCRLQIMVQLYKKGYGLSAFHICILFLACFAFTLRYCKAGKGAHTPRGAFPKPLRHCLVHAGWALHCETVS